MTFTVVCSVLTCDWGQVSVFSRLTDLEATLETGTLPTEPPMDAPQACAKLHFGFINIPSPKFKTELGASEVAQWIKGLSTKD